MASKTVSPYMRNYLKVDEAVELIVNTAATDPTLLRALLVTAFKAPGVPDDTFSIFSLINGLLEADGKSFTGSVAEQLIDLLHGNASTTLRHSPEKYADHRENMRLMTGHGAPYSLDELRVVKYLKEITPGVGAGGDPIGFLIASHNSLSALANPRPKACTSRTKEKKS